MKVIKLRAGKERSLSRHHPWVFQGSVEKGKADAGETVRVEASDGTFLAWGAYSPESQIRVRAWSFEAGERIDADVNAFLRERLAAGDAVDAIVLDPPKFAPTAAHADRASRAYKDINRLALKLLKPGGLLLTFSCSGGISADLFHKIVAGAAMDAQVDGTLLEKLEGAPDHPTTLMFPEGEYLKGLAILKS